MPKLNTAQRLRAPVHAPEHAHVPSQRLADGQQYSRTGLFDRGSFRQDLCDRVLHAEAFLFSLALRHIDMCTDNLNKLTVRGEQMMASCCEIFDCPIGEYNFEL